MNLIKSKQNQLNIVQYNMKSIKFKLTVISVGGVALLLVLSSIPGADSIQPQAPAPGGLYETLRGYAGELGNLMKEVSSGVQKLGQQVKNFEDFLDATVDEDCYFECPPGQVAKKRPGHKPESNGCGAYGLEQFITADMLPVTGFVDCCDVHDFCYETCGNDKDECDLKFKKCLYRKCSAMKEEGGSAALKHKLSVVGCKASAKILYTGTTAVGCKPYLDAQQSACICKSVRDEF